MDIFLGIVHIALLIALLLVMGARPKHATLSAFERKRRLDDAPSALSQAERREHLLPKIYAAQHVKAALLLVVSSFVGVTVYGWPAVFIALFFAIFGTTLAHTALISRFATKLYDHIEPRMISLLERFPRFFGLLRAISPTATETPLASKEELIHSIEEAGDVIREDQRQTMLAFLRFDGKTVAEVMTPRAAIETIKKTEILGPVVMDDLHKKGHSRIPVTDGDLDHVMGILYIQDLLTIEGGKRYTRTVEKAMEKKVYYIKETQTLDQALAAFLKTKHHLFIVVNEYRETVGILTLEDVIEVLLGHKIIDEFDVHDDLRAVAARKSQGNNAPTGRVDV